MPDNILELQRKLQTSCEFAVKPAFHTFNVIEERSSTYLTTDYRTKQNRIFLSVAYDIVLLV